MLNDSAYGLQTCIPKCQGKKCVVVFFFKIIKGFICFSFDRIYISHFSTKKLINVIILQMYTIYMYHEKYI